MPLLENAMLRGADVTLVTGRTSIKKPDFVKIIDVLSAQDMFEAVDDKFRPAGYCYNECGSG